MAEQSQSVTGADAQPAVNLPPESAELKGSLRSALPFVLIALALYAGIYVATELLIARHALRNRFYMVKTAPHIRYDYVILGASHAVVLDNRDMNARLEQISGATILNLSTVGGGITVNRLLLDYFLAAHQTASVVHVLDSFPFYSRQWNEERLRDAKLFQRAPWDPTLAWLLVRKAAIRPLALDYTVALDYILGFSKINNPDRFAPDLHDQEGPRFERVYRPVEQIDRQRIAYLYPKNIEETSLRDNPYLAEFEGLIGDLQERNIRFVVIRPPIPERIYRMIPNERQFDAALKALLERHGVELHDFSAVNNDPRFFFDSDHLNQAGVLSFFENHLKDVLTPGGGSE